VRAACVSAAMNPRLLAAALAVALPVASATAAPKPPGPGGAPTLKATPTIVVLGGSTTLTGKVPGAKGNATVTLQRDPFPLGDGFSNFRTATVGKGGSFSFTVPPFAATTYRVLSGSASSPPVTVKVRPLIGLSVARSGSLTRFYGSVKPARDGARVSIQRKSPTGAWTTVRRATLKDAGSARSTYSARLAVHSAGTYRTKLAAAPGYLSSTSRERAVTAR
jgi:hypothetical protein